MLLTTKEVADILRVSPKTVTRLASSRLIAHVRVGDQYRFSREAVDAYIAAQTVAPKKSTAVWEVMQAAKQRKTPVSPNRSPRVMAKLEEYRRKLNP